MKSISNENTFILITGAGGFIGFALARKLLRSGYKVVGIDNLNNYYDPNLKKRRIEQISLTSKESKGEWKFEEVSIENEKEMYKVFRKYKPSVVYNLAAQAGVRYSIDNPKSYIFSNLVGFANILELCRKFKVKNLIYASSSSIYGGNKKIPFDEEQNSDHPISLYAATKKSNELLAHSYSHLYGIPCTGLRFFTVYGPWGRPDMAPMIFAKALLNKIPINVYNFGKMQRDFTYIDDVVIALEKFLKKPANSDPNFDFLNPNSSSSFAPHMVFNIGNSKPIELLHFIKELELAFGMKAILNLTSIEPGDVKTTFADTKKLKSWIGYNPSTSLKKGIKNFANWYLDFYSKK